MYMQKRLIFGFCLGPYTATFSITTGPLGAKSTLFWLRSRISPQVYRLLLHDDMRPCMYWIYCIYRTFGKSGIYLYAKHFIMSKMLLSCNCFVQSSFNIFMHCMHHVFAYELAVQSAFFCSEKIKWPLAPKHWAFIKPLFEAYCYQFLLCDESYMEGEINLVYNHFIVI